MGKLISFDFELLIKLNKLSEDIITSIFHSFLAFYKENNKSRWNNNNPPLQPFHKYQFISRDMTHAVFVFVHSLFIHQTPEMWYIL